MPLRRFVPVPSLEGRLCLVTGAASGIGRATAHAAARAGARLVITDVNDAALQSVAAQLGDAAALARALDIADVDAVRSLADETHAELGSVDVAMNIAGIATWGSVDRLSRDQWRRTVDVNLMGPIHVVESFVPAVNTPIVDAVDIAGVNRDAFHASPATGRSSDTRRAPTTSPLGSWTESRATVASSTRRPTSTC
jgi:NAD(P)-dependent dehydrogenase (short-subunit alcohol dehydrogenase family)